MQIGLVGLPGVGKTTLFNTLVKANAEIGGYAGLKNPNRGTVKVPDRRVARLSELFQPAKTTYATVDYLDIAGITSGAGKHEAQGEGSLASLRPMDVLVHVLRGFRALEEDIASPREDFENVALELAVSDLEIIERRLVRLDKESRLNKSSVLTRERELLGCCRDLLESGGAIREMDMAPEDEKLLRGFQFLTQKPMLVVLNIEETQIGQDTECLATLENLGPRLEVMALCAKVEMEIAQLDEADAEVFFRELGIAEPALSRMILTSYRLLNLISFFTVGSDEVRAWTITRGTTAPVAAGVIHSDLERGFIRAEAVGWEDLLACGGWAQARDKGLLRLEGKQYIVQDGDVMNIRFSV